MVAHITASSWWHTSQPHCGEGLQPAEPASCPLFITHMHQHTCIHTLHSACDRQATTQTHWVMKPRHSSLQSHAPSLPTQRACMQAGRALPPPSVASPLGPGPAQPCPPAAPGAAMTPPKLLQLAGMRPQDAEERAGVLGALSSARGARMLLEKNACYWRATAAWHAGACAA